MLVGEWLPFSETFIYAQVRHQRRYRARVLCRGDTPHAPRFPYPDRVRLRGLERLTYGFGGASSWHRALRDVPLVHAHYGLNGVVALPYLGQRPLVVTFHGHDVAGLFERNRWTLRYGRYQALASEMFQRASRLLVVSNELRQRLVERGAPESKLFLHRLGVDLSPFSASPRPPPDPSRPFRVLMVGRMVEKKGMEDGIRAFSRLTRILPQAELHVVGDGPLRAELQALADRCGVQPRFLGVQSADQVAQMLIESHLLLMPSKVARNGDREGLPVALQEAGAAWLPAVCTQHGGIPELIQDGENGLLAAEGDVEGLADRMAAVLTDPDLWTRLSRRARKRVAEDFDAITQARRLEDHFDRALEPA